MPNRFLPQPDSDPFYDHIAAPVFLLEAINTGPITNENYFVRKDQLAALVGRAMFELTKHGIEVSDNESSALAYLAVKRASNINSDTEYLTPEIIIGDLNV